MPAQRVGSISKERDSTRVHHECAIEPKPLDCRAACTTTADGRLAENRHGHHRQKTQHSAAGLFEIVGLFESREFANSFAGFCLGDDPAAIVAHV